MKHLIFFLALSLSLFSCHQQHDGGSIDNETLSKKLFDALRDGELSKTEQLFPDKGTYRKIIEEWKNREVEEKVFDSLLSASNNKFDETRALLQDWTDTKYINTHEITTKNGSLLFSANTMKFQQNGNIYKISFTSCRYNGKWFYLGDLIPK